MEELNKRYERLRGSGVPARHRAKTIPFGNDAWITALNIAAGLVLQKSASIALLGDRGTGKTQLAVELIRKACADGKIALYLRAQELYDQVRDGYNKKESEAFTLRRYKTCGLLVIDEVHERVASDFGPRLLTLLVDLRYGAMLPTVLIANQKGEEFMKNVGPSIVDRLNEDGGIIYCEWPSFRGQV